MTSAYIEEANIEEETGLNALQAKNLLESDELHGEEEQITGRFDRLLTSYKETTGSDKNTHSMMGFFESVQNGEFDDLIFDLDKNGKFERTFLQNAIAKAMYGQPMDDEEYKLVKDLYVKAVEKNAVHMDPKKLN